MPYVREKNPPILYHRSCLKFYQHTKGKDGHILIMAKHVQRHATLTDVAEHSGGAFSGMKFLVDFFTNEAPNVTNLKALNSTEIPMVMIYSREVYIKVSLLLR